MGCNMSFSEELDFYFEDKDPYTCRYIILKIDFNFNPDEDNVYNIETVYYKNKEVKNLSKKNLKKILEQIQETFNENEYLEKMRLESEECQAENDYENSNSVLKSFC